MVCESRGCKNGGAFLASREPLFLPAADTLLLHLRRGARSRLERTTGWPGFPIKL